MFPGIVVTTILTPQIQTMNFCIRGAVEFMGLMLMSSNLHYRGTSTCFHVPTLL